MPDKKTSTILMEVRSDHDGPELRPRSHRNPGGGRSWIQHTKIQPTSMSNALRTNRVRAVLNRLFATAETVWK
jgi:hypothetical protein